MDIKEVLEDFKRILTRMGEESQENAENLDLTELWDITEAALNELKEKDVVKVSPEKDNEDDGLKWPSGTVIKRAKQKLKDKEIAGKPEDFPWPKKQKSDGENQEQWDFRTSAGSGDTIITLTNGNNLTFVATLPSKNFHSNDMIEIIRKLNA